MCKVTSTGTLKGVLTHIGLNNGITICRDYTANKIVAYQTGLQTNRNYRTCKDLDIFTNDTEAKHKSLAEKLWDYFYREALNFSNNVL